MSEILDTLGAKIPEETPLRRAHSIVVSAGGDTASDLANELYALAQRIERADITKGCTGGYSAGSIYSYRVDPEMTHDRYFQEIDTKLRAEREAQR